MCYLHMSPRELMKKNQRTVIILSQLIDTGLGKPIVFRLVNVT